MRKFLFFGLVFLLAFLPLNFFVPVYSQPETYGSDYSQIENIIEEIYKNNIEEVKNRTAGSAGERAFANILTEQVELLGLSFLEERNSFKEEFSISDTKNSQNIIAYKNNNSENFVVLGAHYDAIFKENSFGFNDNLSGVAGVLCLAEKLLNAEPDFNLIIAFYGAEELGCLGSKHFIENLPADIKENILLSINFDSIGGGERLYYFHTDYPTAYGNALDNFAKNQEIKISKPGYNRLFSTLLNNELNYTSVCLNSDNSSFIKQGINSMLLFAGNLDASNGLGFFEKQGHNKIMHNTDTEQVNKEVFGNLFYENIQNSVNFCLELLTADDFNQENFYAGQINPALYSDFILKFFGVAFIAILIIGYIISINFKTIKSKFSSKKVCKKKNNQ